MGKNLSFYNLTGGLNTKQDLFTINSSTNRTESPDMVNIEYYKLGGIKTMEGNIQIGEQFKYNNSTDKITLGYEYKFKNKRYMVVTTFSGGCYIYNEKLKKFEKIYNFPSSTERHSITAYMNGIVVTNGVDSLLYYEIDRNKNLDGNIISIVNQTNTIRVTLDTDYNIGQFTEGEVVSYINPSNNTTYYIKINEIIPQTTDNDNVINAYLNVSITDSIKNVMINNFSNQAPTEAIPSTTVTLKQTNYTIFKPLLINSDTNNTIEPIEINGLAINSYKGRLWIGSNDGILFASEIGLLTFDIKYGAIAYDQFYEDESNITALGIWTEYLICHKLNTTYIIDANSDNIENWTVKPYSEMSCASQQSFIANDIGYYIFDKINKGIFPLLSRSLYNTTYLGKELSIKISDIFVNLDYEKLDQIYITYYPLKQYVLFYMNFINGNGYSNKVYIYDLLTKSWIYRELPQQVTTAFKFDNYIYIGTQDGYILKEFTGSTFNGIPIKFNWTSPSYIWGGGTNKTTTKEFRVKLNNVDSNHFYISSIINGERETKDKRLVSNTINTGTALIWDTGYNLDEMILDKTKRTVYHYKATNEGNKDYYSLKDALTNSNIKMYYDINCTQYAGLNQDLHIITDGSATNYSYIKYTNSKGSKWQGKNEIQRCYVRPTDTTHKVWVGIDDTTKGKSNYRIRREIDLYGYSNGKVSTRMKLWVYNELVKRFNNHQTGLLITQPGEFQIYENSWQNGGEWRGNKWTWIPRIMNINGILWGPYEYWFDHRDKTSERISWLGNEFNRHSDNDTYKTEEDYNKDYSPEGEYYPIDIKNYSDETIQIEVPTSNSSTSTRTETLIRYPEGDTGTNNSYPRYLKNVPNNVKVGDVIYNSDNLLYEVSTVKSITTDTDFKYKITDSNDISFYFIEETNIKEPIYKLKKQLVFNLIDTEQVNVNYPYPTEEGRSLTDTTWDNNLWVKLGFNTKRLLLSGQYFETIQYKLFGNSDKDSINIAGFEVDGIQINEVPW